MAKMTATALMVKIASLAIIAVLAVIAQLQKKEKWVIVEDVA